MTVKAAFVSFSRPFVSYPRHPMTSASQIPMI